MKFIFTALPALLSVGRRDAVNPGVSMFPRAEIALVVISECRALDERIVSDRRVARSRQPAKRARSRLQPMLPCGKMAG